MDFCVRAALAYNRDDTRIGIIAGRVTVLAVGDREVRRVGLTWLTKGDGWRPSSWDFRSPSGQ
jgi:hypothetical protein